MIVQNLNLFFSLVAATTTLFLGMVVYFHDRRSATNVIFIVHAFIGTLWSVATYFSLVAAPDEALFWIRAVIFFAVPHVFLFFLFVVNFPRAVLKIRSWVLWGSLTLMGMLMVLTTTPYIFKTIRIADGQVLPVPGDFIALFGLTLVVFFVFTAILVFRKYFQSESLVKRQWITIGLGLISAYTLLIFFVFLRVILFDDTRFVPYSPLFILPIFVGAAYAILKHHLFNVKVIATEILTFVLLVGNLAQVFLAETPLTGVLSLGVAVFLLYFGILLIQSVLKEVEQREELQRLNKQLEEAKVKLEDLNRFKTQLLSLASHQVKSPLAAIKGFVSLILEGAYGPVSDQVKETLNKVKNSTDSLVGLINTLLDLRNVEEGKMDYQFSRTELGALVRGVVEELSPLTRQKNLKFDFPAPSEELFVSADAQKLKQVVQNLIDNAIKYTPSGFVNVALQVRDGEAVFEVADSGLGISQTLLPQVFEEFVRDERVKKEIKGTGLGLYIAKKIVEAHGGKIWAESEGENKGSKFFVSLRIVE